MGLVSLRQCGSYDYAEVKNAIKKSIFDLGGIEKYIQKNDTVLLKVNLVLEKNPDSCATTHPSVVKALAELIIEYGANVIIGDSPGGTFNESRLRSVYKITGMAAVAEETGAKLNMNCKEFEKPTPDGMMLKKIRMTDMLNDATKVISVAKLKTHIMMTYTGALKNMFGVIPGITKAKYHYNLRDYNDFANTLIDICNAANPVLSFIDGVIGMEGSGPTSGKPRKLGVIIASPSPFCADAAALKIINLDENQVPVTAQAIKRGFLQSGLKDTTLVGDDICKFTVPDYAIPKILSLQATKFRIPVFARRFFSMHLQTRPEFIREKCVMCGLCAKSCPAKIIKLKPGAKIPVYNPEKCIRCYCCHELCPKAAINVKKPLVTRFMK